VERLPIKRPVASQIWAGWANGLVRICDRWFPTRFERWSSGTFLLRGGSPSSRDRLLALRFGTAAVRALEEGKKGVMVGLNPPNIHHVPLEEATRNMKLVPIDCDMIQTAEDLGTCMGR